MRSAKDLALTVVVASIVLLALFTLRHDRSEGSNVHWFLADIPRRRSDDEFPTHGLGVGDSVSEQGLAGLLRDKTRHSSSLPQGEIIRRLGSYHWVERPSSVKRLPACDYQRSGKSQADQVNVEVTPNAPAADTKVACAKNVLRRYKLLITAPCG